MQEMLSYVKLTHELLLNTCWDFGRAGVGHLENAMYESMDHSH